MTSGMSATQINMETLRKLSNVRPLYILPTDP